MNNITKSLVVASVVGVFGIGNLATATIAGAETTSTTSSTTSLIDKIASTFNIDKEKLQTIFDEEREARETERAAARTERLQALVDDGTITEAQKTAIEAKIAEMKSERESNHDALQDMTTNERKTKMEEQRRVLESWADEQGLELSELRGILGGGHGGPDR